MTDVYTGKVRCNVVNATVLCATVSPAARSDITILHISNISVLLLFFLHKVSIQHEDETWLYALFSMALLNLMCVPCSETLVWSTYVHCLNAIICMLQQIGYLSDINDSKCVILKPFMRSMHGVI